MYELAYVIDSPISYAKDLKFIPYQSDPNEYLRIINGFPKGSDIYCHQGFKGADKGDYIKDDSAIDVELVKDYRVFSGHYHRHQTIGTVTYVGNPFTMSYGEAFDGPKGFLIVNEDNSFEQVVLPYRRHRIVPVDARLGRLEVVPSDDLIWLKLTGTAEEVAKFKLTGDCRVEKIITSAPTLNVETANLTGEQILDALIDNESDSEENKRYLKDLWREVVE